MSDIILINSPISFVNMDKTIGDETWCPPLGILYLASTLEKSGYSVKVIDVRAQKFGLERIIQTIKEEGPLLVGISSLTSGIRSAVQCAQRIRKEFKDSIKICIGGSHISADPTLLDRYNLFDFAVTGEAELTFKKLVDQVFSGQHPSGIIPAELPQDLDSIPFPASHLINPDLYNVGGIKTAFMITSRGCPYKCTFCSRPALSKKVRYRSSENVIDEIRLLTHSGYRNFNFLDDTFTIHMARTYELCQGIINADMRIGWACVTRADRVNNDLAEIMAKAGCQEIVFGVESGNEFIRNTVVKKNIHDYQVLDAIKWCKKHKITATLFLMVGFPQETKEHLEDTIDYGLKVKADGIGVHITVPMPGSELFEYAIREGSINSNVIDSFIEGKLGEGFRGVWPVYVPAGMTEADLERARTKAHRKFYFRPSYIFKRFLKDLTHLRQFESDMKIVISLLKHGRTETAIS